MLKTAILEFIAQMYSTTPAEVARDVRAMPDADKALDDFCEAMEEAGY